MTSERPYGFIKAMEFTLPWEAGRDRNGKLRADGGLVTDTGGVTKWGISDRADGVVDACYKGKPIKDLTLEDAFEIYKAWYWDVYITLKPINANLDNLPTSLAVATFDAGVNCGPNRAVRWLGKALEAKSPTKALNDLRGAYYFDLVSQDRIKFGPFFKGWNNRLVDLRKYCEVLEQEAQNSFDILFKMKQKKS
jgi:hypothetical protein